jgi:hypothetical protein
MVVGFVDSKSPESSLNSREVRQPETHGSLDPRRLDTRARTPKTESMPHIYMQFDFGRDEEKAQLARHKLETWKQAFRLDKKLLYNFERASDGAPAAEPVAAKPEKSKAKSKTKSADEPEATKSNETVKLLLRLGFSSHEKLSEQRWVQRIPTEEPFLAAHPVVLKPGDAGYADTEREFEELNLGGWDRRDARR